MSPSSHFDRLSPRVISSLCGLALLISGAPLRCQIPSSPQLHQLSGVAPLPDSPGETLLLATEDAASSSTSSEIAHSSAGLDRDSNQPPASTSDPAPSRNTRSSFPARLHLHSPPRDKVLLGFRNVANPFTAFGWLSAAAYSQALNSAPNYGQGWGPFAQRFGAAAVRGGSDEIFSTSVFAPVFHEDPRFYVLGPSHPPIKRIVYAVTRPLVTRSDSGRPTPNFALLSGNAAGSLLTNAYIPQRNRTATVTVETFAGSLGGAALGFVLREFLADALGVVHLSSIE